MSGERRRERGLGQYGSDNEEEKGQEEERMLDIAE